MVLQCCNLKIFGTSSIICILSEGTGYFWRKNTIFNRKKDSGVRSILEENGSLVGRLSVVKWPSGVFVQTPILSGLQRFLADSYLPSPSVFPFYDNYFLPEFNTKLTCRLS